MVQPCFQAHPQFLLHNIRKAEETLLADLLSSPISRFFDRFCIKKYFVSSQYVRWYGNEARGPVLKLLIIPNLVPRSPIIEGLGMRLNHTQVQLLSQTRKSGLACSWVGSSENLTVLSRSSPKYDSIPQHDVVVSWGTTYTSRWIFMQPTVGQKGYKVGGGSVCQQKNTGLPLRNEPTHTKPPLVPSLV